MFLEAGSHDCFALDRFGHVPHSDVNSWLSLRQKQMDELRTCHREQFLSLRSKIRSLEIEAGIASDANPFLRERQQMLLTSKKYGEAYEQLKRAEKNALLVHRKTQRSSTERSIKRLLEQHIQQEEHFHKLFESELNSLELKKTRAPQSQLSHKHGSEKHVDAKEPLPKSIFEDVPNDQEVGGGEFRGAHYSEEHGNGTTAPNLREEPSINAHMDQRLTVNRAGYALFDGKTRPAFSPLLPVDCKPTSGPQLMASAPSCRGGPSAFRYKLHDLADKLYRTESSLSPRRVLRKCSRVDDEFGQAHDDSDDFSARAVNDPNKSESSLYISNGLRKIPGCWQIPCVYPQSTSEPRCSDGDHGSTSVGRLENAAEALLSAASALLGSRVTGTNISTAVNESIQGKPKFGRASLEDDTFEIDPVSKTNPDSRFQTRRSHPLVSEIDPGVHNACAKTIGFKVSKSSPDIFSEDISGDDVLALPTSCPVSTCTVPRLEMKKLSFVAESPDLATGSADHVLLDKNGRGLEHLNRTQRSLPRSTQITERRSAKETKYVFGGDSPTPAGPNGRAPAARLLIDRARPSAENTEHRKCQTDPWGQSKGSHIPENQKSQDAASNEADLQPDSPQIQTVNDPSYSGPTRIRTTEHPLLAASNADRRFTTEDFRNLFSYARHGKYKQVVELLKGGCPAEGRDQFGNTPLIIACQNGNARIVKALIRHGALINSQNKQGCTGLHYCIAYGFNALSDYLISKGANDKILNKLGLSPYEGIK